jgi:hypothetical protein
VAVVTTPGDSTAQQWDDLGGVDGCTHDLSAEIMASYPGRPTPAEAVAMGVTGASGAGHGDGFGSAQGPAGGGI